MEILTVPEEKTKPAFDERALDKLLEAAFVLQEHNRELRELDLRLQMKRDQVEADDQASAAPTAAPIAPATVSSTQPDYTLTLGKIVDTQHHIRIRKLGLDESMALVAERIVDIGAASGAAIAIANGQSVRYPASAGLKTLPVDTVVPITKALCSACIASAQVVRCPDILSENQLDTEECRRRGIQSLILAPIFHEGEVAGALELYYATPHAFTDQDVHTCQLMAGLVTEALVREEELTWKKSLAEERTAMLQALEKLQPNLAALVDKPSAQKTAASAASSPAAGKVYVCHKCGHGLLEREQFCGECGSPRAAAYESPRMQSKVATLWHMQEADGKENPAALPNEAFAGGNLAAKDFSVQALGSHLDEASLPGLEEIVAPLSLGSDELETSVGDKKAAAGFLEHEELEPSGESNYEENGAIQHEEATEEESAEETVTSEKLTLPGDWSSAASAREFLEKLSSSNQRRSIAQFWNARRGDIYLAIALLLVACVIRWGVWSNHAGNTGAPKTATAAHKKAPADADLSVFDRMLVRLGLAEAPAPPDDKGNPSAQVWVDERTALYYCPGADLYGKTSKGKFTSQRDAQLDQFEPAYRKTCN